MKIDSTLALGVERLARTAGRAILEVYATPFGVAAKADNSPVTLADQRAEAIILQGLASLTPGVPIVAEEAVATHGLPDLGKHSLFWLVDPLDGTREFVGRNGEFTVNIALVGDGKPVLGVVYTPVQERLHAGTPGSGAWVEGPEGRCAIRTRHVPAAGLTVVSSRSHGDEAALTAWLGERRVAQRLTAGSSLKLCLIAEGRADLYPRFGRTMEWDIAAGHAVLTAAGGHVLRLDDNQPLRYAKPGFENPAFFACGEFRP